jgi:enoyl-CoA hydratase/carnithine racemase
VNDDVYCSLTFENHGGYVVLDLTNRAVDAGAVLQTAMDLEDVCTRIAWDEQIRVVVLCFDGSGDERSPLYRAPIGGVQPFSLAGPISALRQPVIAAIRGSALGQWLELALACDIRIGTESARFGLPQISCGSMPSDGGTQRLPRIVGRGRAMQMILTGETIDAEDACRSGLINRVVPASKLLQASTDMARKMAEQSPLSLSYAKEALNKALDLTLDQGIRMEMDLYLLLFSTMDRVEGITAFKEKRKPKFEGV